MNQYSKMSNYFVIVILYCTPLEVFQSILQLAAETQRSKLGQSFHSLTSLEMSPSFALFSFLTLLSIAINTIVQLNCWIAVSFSLGMWESIDSQHALPTRPTFDFVVFLWTLVPVLAPYSSWFALPSSLPSEREQSFSC